MRRLVQCLVFLESENKSIFTTKNLIPGSRSSDGGSASKKYILFPSAFKNHPHSKTFRQGGFQVEIDPPTNLQFEFFELFLDEKLVSEKLSLEVDDHYYPLLVQLLGENSFSRSNKSAHQFDTFKWVSAIDEENIALIEKFLTNGADIRYNRKGTVLHFAVETGRTDLIKLLLEHGANPNAKMNDCSTGLHIAVKRNDVEIVKLLLENNADGNAVMTNCVTPLHLAAEKGCTEIVKLLVNYGADLSVRNGGGSTPLHIAVKNGHAEIVEHLLLHGANPNIRGSEDPQFLGEMSLHRAILQRQADLTALLLRKGADINSELHDGRTALYLAVKEGKLNVKERLDICYTLIKYGPDVNLAGNRKAFYYALSKRDRKYHGIMTECLLKYKFDVNVDDADNPHLLFGAVSQNLRNTVKKLLDFGANINQFSEFEGEILTPLHEATMLADVAMIQLLLDRGANVNASVGSGSVKLTPLSKAIKYFNIRTVKALLANNADITDPLACAHSASSKVGSSSSVRKLEIIEQHSAAVVQALLEHGANVNSYNSEEQTPLSLAAFTSNFQAFNMLIKFGAHGYFRDRGPQNVSFSDNFQVFLDHGFTDFDLASEIHCQKFFSRPQVHTKLSNFAEKLACLIVKMEVAYKSIGPVIPTQLHKKLKLSDFRNDCGREIGSMKLKVIPDTEVSFYNILTKKTYQMSCYARNEHILHTMETVNIKEKFPIYASILECQVRKGILRRELVSVGMKTLSFLSSGFFELPHDLKERIINYLNNQDILILQKCWNNEAKNSD